MNRNAEISVWMINRKGACALGAARRFVFELGNEDRLRILVILQEKPNRLTHLSESLELSVQETSRHLSRLSEAKLITKNAEGMYCLLPLGRDLLQLLPGLGFLATHGDYLNCHDISRLPNEFMRRIGELDGSAFTDDAFTALHLADNVVREANDHVWIIGTQVLMSTVPLLEEAIERGATFRLIMPRDVVPPPGFKPIRTWEDRTPDARACRCHDGLI